MIIAENFYLPQLQAFINIIIIIIVYSLLQSWQMQLNTNTEKLVTRIKGVKHTIIRLHNAEYNVVEHYTNIQT